MKILFINGSPRVGGNSDFLIQKLTEFCYELGMESEEIKLRGLKIESCLACELCHEQNDSCPHKDDFVRVVFPKLREVEAVFLVSPVYQGGVTGAMKDFMDRCEMFRHGRLLHGKLCGGAAIGGYPGGGQELTLMQIQYFAHICAMRYVASWGKIRSHLGGHCIAFKKQEILNDLDGIDASRNVISEMAELGKLIKKN